ncbi:hypothetical protein V6N11_000319 [Hibiscus sabdariffa]|uniref:Uncharacterized protein n=2 Tax=Hibiscus sabdariffa TaxID=183260 RepID=A0ABR2NJ10_9ROSI
MGQTCFWARIRWAKGESWFFPLLDHATPALGLFRAGCMAGSGCLTRNPCGDECVRWWWGMAKMRAYGSMKGLGSWFGCEDDGTMAAAGKGHLWELLGWAKGGSVWVCKRPWDMMVC